MRLPNGMTMTITGRTADAVTVAINVDEWAERRLAEIRAHLPGPVATSPDAMRLDASRAEADAELAEWRALLDGAKGRRRG